MAKFDAKNPPIFFDASGRRWLFTKIITAIILINLLLLGTLVTNYYNQSGALEGVKGSFKSLIYPISNAKANTITDGNHLTYSIISPVEYGNYSQVRDKIANLDYVLCECYTIKGGKLIDNAKSNSDLKLSLSYLVNNPDNKIVPVYQYIKLATENLGDLDLLYSISASRIVIDLNKNSIDLNQLNTQKLEQLNNNLTKKGIQLDFVAGTNQSLKTLSWLKNIASKLYIVPISFTKDGNLDTNYKLEIIKELAKNTGSKPLNLLYPSLPLDGVQEMFESRQVDEIKFDDNFFPFVETDQKNTRLKRYLTNEFLFNNFERQMAKININGRFSSIGTDNLLQTSPNGLAFLQSNINTFKNNLLENKFRITDKIKIDGSGEIFELINESTPANLQLSRSNDGSIGAIKFKNAPTLSKVKQSGVKEKTIAITFDDGPNVEYTGKILDILKRYNVKASFFTTGENLIENPDLAERIVKEGHLIGNHTQTHISVNNSSDQTIKEELIKTSNQINKLTLVNPSYFRTPFNDNSTREYENDIRTLRIAKNIGMKITESDTDTHDYEGVTSQSIVDYVFKNTGSQIIMHDSGGKTRVPTIEALPIIIERLQTSGYNIVTVDKLDEDGYQKIASPEIYKIKDLKLPLVLSQFFTTGKYNININKRSFYNLFTVVYWILTVFLFIALLKFAITILGLIFTKKHRFNKEFLEHVTVLVPAYNEEQGVIKTVESLLRSTYKNQTIIVINDGSTDSTLDNLIAKYSGNPTVRILTKTNGGKASALNFGLKNTSDEYIICVDADSIIEKNSVYKLMQHFNDPKVGAVAGNVQIGNEYFGMKANNPKISFWGNFNIWTGLQRLEYTTGQNFIKQASSTFNSILVIAGAIGAFKKSIVDISGGYKTNTLAEDMDLTIDVIRSGWKIKYEPEAFSITEAPETMHQLWKQRIRWGYGGYQVFAKNTDLLFKGKNTMFSMYELPMYLLSQCLMLVSFLSTLPLIYYIVRYTASLFYPSTSLTSADIGNLTGHLYMYFAFIFIEALITLYALYRDKSKGKYQLMWLLPISIFLYNYFRVYVQIIVYVKILSGKAQGWNHLQRTNKMELLTD